MSAERDAFLARVREAVAAGNRAGTPPLPQRGTVGYQGGGSDPVARFCAELTAAGGVVHPAADAPAAVATVLKLVREKGVRRVLLGCGPILDDLKEPLRRSGIEVACVDALDGDDARSAFFAADVGISGVDHLVAETGSLAVWSRPDQPRSLTLLPLVHIALARRSQIVPDLFDLFAEAPTREAGGMPACLTLITGPSKTGDIELKLVTGVHGPGEVHVVLVDA